MSELEDLEPKEVWKIFDEIRKIPRCSKHEEKIREYVLAEAKKMGLDAEEDETGNVVIRKPATGGCERAPTLILQGHLDMVCDKNEATEHDFSKDPIKIKREGDWITADGTTLGADNGIGVAMAMAVAENDSIKHGPLECLMTVDEETGMTGAFGLKLGFVKGKQLINLDTEDFGIIFIGCAGGGGSELRMPLEFSRFEGGETLKVRVAGLKGGHSGCEIHVGRANSVKLLGRLLWKVAHRLGSIQIADIKGGNKHNAIPREASATIVIPPEKEKDLKALLKEELSAVKNEYGKVEPDVEIKAEEVTKEPERVLTKESSLKIINLIQVLPHGVLAMSHEVPELVETSTNLAILSLEEKGLEVMMSTRSSIESALEAARETIHAIADAFGAEIEEEEAYPGWKPDISSHLLQIAKDTFKKRFNHEAKVEAIHAGLETGLFSKKFGKMDMISIGPQIEHPHSPDERVQISTVEKSWKNLIDILETLAMER